MDTLKKQAIIQLVSDQEEPQFIPAEMFFDGNDDLGSIGCNLMEHPGVDAFRSTILGLLARSDVQAVYAQLTELDPGDGSWPFTDTIFVVGTISEQELGQALEHLEPDEVFVAEDPPQYIAERHSGKTLGAWWD